jgi:hypothetical protein
MTREILPEIPFTPILVFNTMLPKILNYKPERRPSFQDICDALEVSQAYN